MKIKIEDELFEPVKKLAENEGKSLDESVNDFLREKISLQKQKEEYFRRNYEVDNTTNGK